MKKNSTKRMLMMSVLSMLLCISMFVGSTFAWFTDSVASGNNIITAGNLDVELWTVEGEIKGADTDPVLFDGVEAGKWEPGAMAWETFTVKNVGNLELKYTFAVNFDNAKLAEVLKVAVIDGKVDNTFDRAAALADDVKYEPMATFELEGVLAEKTEESYTVVIYWEPTDNDNEYKEESVSFNVSLFATQAVKEADSFGTDYDKDAVYADSYVKTADELVAAIAEGGTIALMNNVEVSSISVPKGVTATINLNGNDIIGTSTKDSGNQSSIIVKGDLTVEGIGTVSHVHTGANMGWNNLTAAFSVEGGTLTLGEGVSVVNNGGSVYS